LTTPQTFYQEIGTDVLPIELEKIGARVQGRMRQAPLRLLDPLGNVDPLAKALGLDPDGRPKIRRDTKCLEYRIGQKKCESPTPSKRHNSTVDAN
jgi:hypothetical protein